MIKQFDPIEAVDPVDDNDRMTWKTTTTLTHEIEWSGTKNCSQNDFGLMTFLGVSDDISGGIRRHFEGYPMTLNIRDRRFTSQQKAYFC